MVKFAVFKSNFYIYIEINIGKENKLRLTKALCQMNITSETMYPGLVGLAQSVRRLREGLGDYKD